MIRRVPTSSVLTLISDLARCTRCAGLYKHSLASDDFLVDDQYVCKSCLTDAERAEFTLSNLDTGDRL